jgi:hypothetical protein
LTSLKRLDALKLENNEGFDLMQTPWYDLQDVYPKIRCFFKKLPPYTLAGFDLTTHSSNLLDGRQRPHRQGNPKSDVVGHDILLVKI